jgi:type IV pilus assembly protein PilB
MDIEPFMISSSLLVVCAQRLMRRVNKKTATSYMPEGNEAEIMQRAIGWVGEVLKAADNDIGGPPMKGRVGIHELMTNSEELTKAINDGRETAVLKEVAMRNGMKTLHQDSLLKVKEQTTTILEALSNVPPDLSDEEVARTKAREAAEAASG